MDDVASAVKVAAIIIGRNEGQRLVSCLASVVPAVDRTIYVDSGSTDDSVAAALAAGAEVVQLDMSQTFTAARARNTGLAVLRERNPPQYVQFIDGDCELQPGWIEMAHAFLATHRQAAIACGRRRERFPEASVYNRLCDWEWGTPVGRTKACGGDAFARMSALTEVGGFNPTLIAGEEPEMCVRLRQKDWEIWRLDAEMTLHDAAITRFSQWWTRARRAGYAAAEGMRLHGAPPERLGLRSVARAVTWAAALPLVVLALLAAIGTPALLVLLLYPLQVMRLSLLRGGRRIAWEVALFQMLGKFAELGGIAEYARDFLLGRRRSIIEYK